MKLSRSHVLVIPSYNPGPVVLDVVSELTRRPFGIPIWVMIDGSDDGTPEQLAELAETSDHLRLFRFPENRGKGTVMLAAAKQALDQGFTHLLSFDSDGQHPADDVAAFLQTSNQRPDAMVLGKPKFGREAPIERVWWRKLANILTGIFTLGGNIGDCLFGMRIYPVERLVSAMESTRWARRFDFEPEMVIRLSWLGTPAINIPTPVRYLKREEGGVSHFRYGRDNLLLSAMYFRLMLGFLIRLPKLIRRRLQAALA